MKSYRVMRELRVLCRPALSRVPWNANSNEREIGKERRKWYFFENDARQGIKVSRERGGADPGALLALAD